MLSLELSGLVAALVDAAPDDESDAERDRVLVAARSAFLDFGIRRTSMAEIARRGGISPATLYRWYGSKDDVVLAVVLREVRGFAVELDAAVDPEWPAEQQLTELTVRVAQRLRSQPLLRRLLETEPETILPRLTVDGGALVEAGVAFATLHIQRMIDRGVVAPFDPVPLAEILTRIVHSLLLTPATALPLDDDERLRTFAADAIRLLLPAAPSPTSTPSDR